MNITQIIYDTTYYVGTFINMLNTISLGYDFSLLDLLIDMFILNLAFIFINWLAQTRG